VALTTITGVAIRAIASAIPESVRVNSDIGGADDQSYVEKMSVMMGVSQRHIVREGQVGSDLAVAAAKSLLDNLHWDVSTIDLLVVATQTPDRLFPGTSFLLHRQLGLAQTCPVFDINLGCSAFTHGLWTVASLLSGVGKRAVLINVDTMSRTLGDDDFGNQVLFGDGATATGLELDDAASPITAVLTSDGKGSESVCYPNSGMSASAGAVPRFIINGPAVLGLALRSVPRLVAQLLEAADITIDEVGLFVPHQANVFILDKLSERLGLAPEKVLIAMESLGNTSSSSIPLSLCARPDVVAAADRRRVMMVGFGTGFSLSAVLADLSATSFSVPVLVP